jgi:predicted O-methyltransferase YrrM
MDSALKLWHLPAVGRAKSSAIRRLIDRHGPKNAIEIGSLFGYSAIVIGGSLPAGGRLTCIEANPYLARFVRGNAEAAGLKKIVTVIAEDAIRALPLLRGRYDFAFIDATKEEYLDYLRGLEPRLRPGAVVVADNTGVYRREVKPYLDHVRESGRYRSREHDFGDDCMEVSILEVGEPQNGPGLGPRRSRGAIR